MGHDESGHLKFHSVSGIEPRADGETPFNLELNQIGRGSTERATEADTETATWVDKAPTGLTT